ncbi:MAG: PEGA domain-containing protein [Myxococcaceae bacterium]|nr:PEGA domain-containing protein [Myxococcaceae bacterium]
MTSFFLFIAAAAQPLTPAAVESTPTAALFVLAAPGTTPSAAAEADAQLRQALLKTGVQLPSWTLPARISEAATAKLKLISEGRQAYDNLDIDGAIEKLTQARMYFQAHPAESDSGSLADLSLALGAAYLQNGLKAEAQRAFVDALLLNPDLKPSTKLFTPDVQAAFARARSDVTKEGQGRLTIATEPMGAAVELRGQALGYTPLPTYALPAGRHLVQAKRPGFATAGTYVVVEASQTVSANLQLTPVGEYGTALALATRLINGNAFEGNGIPDEAKELATRAQSRFLVMVKVSATPVGNAKAHVQVWDTMNFSRLKDVSFTVDASGKNAQAAVKTLRPWLEKPVVLSRAPAMPSHDGSQPVYKKWWFWTAVGGAAVAGAVTSAVVVSQRGRSNNFILGIP